MWQNWNDWNLKSDSKIHKLQWKQYWAGASATLVILLKAELPYCCLGSNPGSLEADGSFATHLSKVRISSLTVSQNLSFFVIFCRQSSKASLHSCWCAMQTEAIYTNKLVWGWLTNLWVLNGDELLGWDYQVLACLPDCSGIQEGSFELPHVTVWCSKAIHAWL